MSPRPARRATWLLVLVWALVSCSTSSHRPPPEHGLPEERRSEVPPPATDPRSQPERRGEGARTIPEERRERMPVAEGARAGQPRGADIERPANAVTDPETPPPPARAGEPMEPAPVPEPEARPEVAPPQEAPPGAQEAPARPEDEPAPVAQETRADLPPHFEPFPDRWSIEPPPYEINKGKSPWDPYNLNPLKGDYPLIGQDIFFRFEAENFTVVEGRAIPLPTGITGSQPGNEDFFGDRDQFFLTSTLALAFEIFKGQESFKPVDWRLRIIGAANLTHLSVGEVGIVNIDPDDGTERTTTDLALEEAFLEVHLLDWNDRYDFLSSEAGILEFRSDFRGWIFDDINLGARIFGNADDNKWQYNLAAFNLLEKETNSELNTFEERDQEVIIANVYRFDFPVKGWNQSLSFHYNHDDDSLYFDRNDFLRRPAPIGIASPHEIDAYYFGWTSEGHFERFNISSAFYQVWGTDSLNPLAGREVDIDAQLAALELSYDFDWFRVKLYGLYASGDDDTRDGDAEGFDAIVDAPNFAGGEFSYWNRQGIPLLGTFLTNRLSPLADLQATKFEGQSQFVNPGIIILGIGADFEITPTLRALVNMNYIRFDEVDPLEIFLELENIDHDVGFEGVLGIQYRPLLTNNIILTFGASALRPGRGLRKIFESDSILWHTFLEVTLTW